MFVKDFGADELVRILNLDELFNPLEAFVWGRSQCGQEEQDPVRYAKDRLVFPSGEPLPRCWVDVHYRERRERRTASAR